MELNGNYLIIPTELLQIVDKQLVTNTNNKVNTNTNISKRKPRIEAEVPVEIKNYFMQMCSDKNMTQKEMLLECILPMMKNHFGYDISL